MEEKKEQENTVQNIMEKVYAAGSFLQERGAYISNDKIIIEKNENGMLQATVTIALHW